MKRRLFNPFLILFLLFVFISPNLVKAEDAGYYGYKSRKIITEALGQLTQISESKKVAILNQLSEDGYFWFRTKQQKQDYIRTNIANNEYLSVVADAENIHSWTVNEDLAKLQYADSKQSQDTLSKVGSQYYQIFKAANAHSAENCRIVINKTGQSMANPKAFSYKACWSGDDLNQLYLTAWPNLGGSRSNPNFTASERKALIQILDIIGPRLAGQTDLPAEETMDILFIIPGADVAGALTGTGVKTIFKPVVKVGTEILTNVMRTGGGKVIKKVVDEVVDYSIRTFGVHIRFNLTMMFKGSTFRAAQRESFIQDARVALEGIAEGIKANNLGGIGDQNAIIIMKKWQNYFDKIKFISPAEFAKKHGMKEAYDGLAYIDIETDQIFINEIAFIRPSAFTRTLVWHEMNHSASFFPTRTWENEAMTELITKIQSGVVGYDNKVYVNYVKVTQEILNNLIKEKGQTEGMRIFYEAYYLRGIEPIQMALPKLNWYHLDDLVDSRQFEQAIQYLRGLY